MSRVSIAMQNRQLVGWMLDEHISVHRSHSYLERQAGKDSKKEETREALTFLFHFPTWCGITRALYFEVRRICVTFWFCHGVAFHTLQSKSWHTHTKKIRITENAQAHLYMTIRNPHGEMPTINTHIRNKKTQLTRNWRSHISASCTMA